MLHTIRYLLNNRVSVDELNSMDFELRPRLLILGVNGEVKSNEFIRLAKIEREKIGLRFDPQRRFICSDENLMYLGGRTYAINGEWTETKFKNAISLLNRNYPELKIDFEIL